MADLAGPRLLRVLLIEDSEEDAELIENLLCDGGYTLESHRVDTVDALSRALGEQRWDIILADYDMPHFSGFGAIEMVRKRGLDTPVILVSGAVGEEQAVEALKAGAADYVLKRALVRLPHAVERARREVDKQLEHRAAVERVRLLAAIVESSQAAVIGETLDGTITSWNQSAERLYGYTAAEALGCNVSMLAPPDQQDEIPEILTQIASGETVEQLEATRLRNDGQPVAVLVTISPVFDTGGTIVGVSSISLDITALKQAEQLRRASEERYRSVVESSLDGIVTTDLQGIVTLANQKIADLLGYGSPAELIGRQNFEMIVPEDRELTMTKMSEVVGSGFVRNVRCTLVRSDGTTFPAEMGGTLLRDEAGAPIGMTGTIRDVTDRLAYEEQLQLLALHDPLTGLPNRTLLNDRLEQALLNRHTMDAPVSLLLLSLDEFKIVNDTFGHNYGDEVLREVGRRLQRDVRESDTVARSGGDEFLIVLPGADTTRALLLAGNILNSLEEPMTLEDHQIPVTGSIGIANRPDHGNEAAALLRFAEIAMYRAKREKTGCAIYTSGEDSTMVEHFGLVRDLRQGIQLGELCLHYQPQVDLHTGRVRGVEALVRWQHPIRGMIPPNQFIDLAERAGLMKSLTAWVLGEATRQAAAWHAHGLEITVAVNLSAEDLHDPGLLDVIRHSIELHGADPAWLEMEITETGIMRQPEYALETIKRLKALGLNISIDDFGTGYSSLGYLKRFPTHELKIDTSFVLDMSEDENDAIIVAAIIDLGHKLGLQVVAEGVEDQVTLDLLAGAGCDIVQGYYLSQPLTADAFEAWLGQPSVPFTESKPTNYTAAS